MDLGQRAVSCNHAVGLRAAQMHRVHSVDGPNVRACGVLRDLGFAAKGGTLYGGGRCSREEGEGQIPVSRFQRAPLQKGRGGGADYRVQFAEELREERVREGEQITEA